MTSMISEQIYQDYLSSLITGDRSRCASIVQILHQSNVDYRDIYLNLFQKSLYDVGDLWEHHQISVAVEHLASAITERLLSFIEQETFALPHHGRTVIVACVADEFHQLGALIVSDIFEIHGWNTHFLGANTPVRDLISMIKTKNPDLLALSLSVYFNIPNLIAALDEIRTSFSDLPILIGGQAFRWGGRDMLSRYSPGRYIADIDELEQCIAYYGKAISS